MNERPATIEELICAAEARLRADPTQVKTVIEDLAHLEAQGYPAGPATVLIFDGNARVMSGDFAGARPVLEKGLALSTELEEPTLQVRALTGLAVLHVGTGAYGQALEYHMQSMQLARTLENGGLLSRSLIYVGSLYAALRNFEQAQAYHREAVEHAASAGRSTFMARLALATDEAQLGHLEEALQQRRELLVEARQTASRAEEAFVLADLAANLLQLDQRAEARQLASEALKRAEALGLQLEKGQALIILASLDIREGQFESAHQALHEVLEIGQRLASIQLLIPVHEELSRLFEQQGDFAGALRHTRVHYELKSSELTRLAERRSQVLEAELKVELLRQQAEEKERQNLALVAINEHLRETQKRLQYAATHDALTGLLVRTALEETVEDDLLLSPERRRALFMIDVDHFKQINDALGHHVGDRFLQELARRLRGALRPTDIVARQGGDEFTIYLRELDSPEEAVALGQQLLRDIAAPVQVEGHLLNVTVSIGIAVYPDDGRDVMTLEKHADLALYRAKEQRHQVRRFQKPAD